MSRKTRRYSGGSSQAINANSIAYINFARRCAAAGATLTGSDIVNYSNLLNGLTVDGIFTAAGTSTKLDCLYILAAPNATVALLDLTNGAFNLTATGSPTFTAYQGYLGVDASTTVYLETGFNPSTAGGNFNQNSAHISAWSNTNAASGVSGGTIMGLTNITSTANSSNILPKYNDGNAYFRITGSNVGGTSNASSLGHYVANRSASNAIQGYKDASSIFTSSDASQSLDNDTFILLANKKAGGGGVDFGGAYQLSMASIGGSLSSGDVTLLYNRIATYRTAVGL